MVKQGMAWAYTTYSWRYLPEEWFAGFEGTGLHARTCTNPSVWRANHQSKR